MTDPAAPGHDPEIWAIFRDEMQRHTTALGRDGADLVARARALHAMKGAAAMMGFADLAAALGEADAAARAGEADAAARALAVAAPLLAELGLAAPTLPAGWVMARAPSERPPSERPPAREAGDRTSGELELLGYFRAEARHRLEEMAQAVAGLGDPAPDGVLRGRFDAALRHLHALKGAAATVGVPAVARGAHALEGALLALRSRGYRPGGTDLAALGAARARLALALGAAGGGASAVDDLVAGLRAAGLLRERDLAGPPEARGAGAARAVDVIRVPAPAVARLAESVGEVGFVPDRLARSAGAVHDAARALARAGRMVDDALRRIGPARPWGAPADALASLAEVQRSLGEGVRGLEREAHRLRHDAELLATVTSAARDALKGLGGSTAGWLFERALPAVAAAAGADKSVRVVREGDATELDRGVAERLVEPLTQLVRNAVAHGIEPQTQRLAAGKSARATLRLEAAVEGDLLRLAVDDDGAGIDLAAVGARAAALGLLPRDRSAGDAEVLEALFRPGVSSRDAVDATAGRGVGLDLVRQEVRALGGVVRVRTRRGVGTRFEIEVLLRPLAQRVLRVRAAGEAVALPLGRVLRVVRPADHPPEAPRVALAALFGRSAPAWRVVVLATATGELGVEVDGIDAPHEIVVRAMPPPLEGIGPWGAAAIEGEGTVTLVVNADRLAAYAR